MKALTYLIYIVLYEALVLGGTAYVVFVLGHSGWWFVLGILLSASAYKPESWIHGVPSSSRLSSLPTISYSSSVTKNPLA